MKNILILGVNGMLGHQLFKFLKKEGNYEVFGTIRSSKSQYKNIFHSVDAFSLQTIEETIVKSKPKVVINCIGIIKQSELSQNSKISIYINSYFPHLLVELSNKYGFKVIQISTDCVFDGTKGYYSEDDYPSPKDMYGRTKLLGEVSNTNALTIRTSIIGHELNSKNGLLEWFFSQDKAVNGYKNAIFTGFPTLELSKIICNYLIPNDELYGLYHIASKPISKFELLNVIKNIYNKQIEIIPEYDFVCDRSLNSEKFNKKTNYKVMDWEALIYEMKQDFIQNENI